MVVNDFNGVRIAVAPDETETPLIVYSNAVLALSPAMQRF
jgi:hypothetical protein